jgi:hypothetical protein
VIVNVEVDESIGFPAPTDGHNLAWGYILDSVFADAYLQGISELTVWLPRYEISRMAQTRAASMGTRPHKLRLPAAFCRHDRAALAGISRLYRLQPGTLLRQPTTYRRASIPLFGWRMEQILYVYTWRAVMWGVSSRVATRVIGNHLADTCHYSMRQAFTSPVVTPAFYVLSIWSPA